MSHHRHREAGAAAGAAAAARAASEALRTPRSRALACTGAGAKHGGGRQRAARHGRGQGAPVLAAGGPGAVSYEPVRWAIVTEPAPSWPPCSSAATMSPRRDWQWIEPASARSAGRYAYEQQDQGYAELQLACCNGRASHRHLPGEVRGFHSFSVGGATDQYLPGASSATLTLATQLGRLATAFGQRARQSQDRNGAILPGRKPKLARTDRRAATPDPAGATGVVAPIRRRL